MVFAINSLNFTFGGYATGTWNWTACCTVSGNDCSQDYACVDRHAASDFTFRLQPGEPQRFLPLGTGIGATDYQRIIPFWWPTWGYFDLRMGDNGSPPGLGGACDQGTTYAGSLNEACGAYRTWGHTDLEVWYPLPPSPPKCFPKGCVPDGIKKKHAKADCCSGEGTKDKQCKGSKWLCK